MMICPRCLRQFGEDADACPDDGTRLRVFRDQTSQLVGSVLDGRWRLEEKIGEGGMGEVYRARQLNVDRVVAIKVLRLALASTEQYVSRFFREADIASSVQHPHFVPIYDFGQSSEDQLLYIAMELLRGETLTDVTRKRRLSIGEVLEIGSQVCAAMAAAHAARIVHRDLKPDNIFLLDIPEGGPFVKVLDFGIAKDLEADKVTRTGQLFGTPEYMSPEQCEGRARVDGRSDLYALGCIMYELLTMRSPFRRDSIIQTLLAQVSDSPEPFGKAGIPVPARVEAIVMRLLEKHPDDRFANAMQARDAMQEALEWIERNPAGVRAYETVSEQLGLRTDAPRTVSYSELGHPLQLEGALAESAKSAVLKQAERRREEAAIRETVMPSSHRRGLAGGAAALASVAMVLAVGFAVFQSEDPVAEHVPAPVVSRVEAAAAVAAEADASAAARRAATSTLIAITTFAVSRPAQGAEQPAAVVSPQPTPEKKKTRKKKPRKQQRVQEKGSEAMLGIRTQTSIRRRFLTTQKALLGCYDRREEPTDQGTVHFRLRIEPDGKVSTAEVTSDTLRSTAALSCMRTVVSGLSFTEAGTSATYDKDLTFRAR